MSSEPPRTDHFDEDFGQIAPTDAEVRGLLEEPSIDQRAELRRALNHLLYLRRLLGWVIEDIDQGRVENLRPHAEIIRLARFSLQHVKS